MKEKTHFWADILDFRGAILEFCVARVTFKKSGVLRVNVPNFMLVSQSERLFPYLFYYFGYIQDGRLTVFKL